MIGGNEGKEEIYLFLLFPSPSLPRTHTLSLFFSFPSPSSLPILNHHLILSYLGPQYFDYHPHTHQPIQRWERAELTQSVVEFIAPSEYMVRPPQPPVYLFLIDVSFPSVQAGVLDTMTSAIRSSLDSIPDVGNRARFGIITYDTSLHFYALPTGAEATSGSEGEEEEERDVEMLVVSDIEEPFLPRPDRLLTHLNQPGSRKSIESLLERLPGMFRDTTVVGSALGPALNSANRLLKSIGGKIIVIQASLPSIGPGALKARDEGKARSSGKESSLLSPQDAFYKNFAVEASRHQIALDVFTFAPSGYADVSTLSCLPRYTGGDHRFYPGFNGSRPGDRAKVTEEVRQFLSARTGLEAVMRIRASKGIRMTAFHGHFFLRSMDLLALPNVTPGHGYGVEYVIEEDVPGPLAYFQTAVLHTSCDGERRIRVVTLALPTTSSLSQLYASIDPQAMAALLGKKGVERSVSAKIEDAREALVSKVAEILRVFKTQLTSTASGATTQLQAPRSLALLPLYILSILKHVSIRLGSSPVPSDLRAQAQNLLTSQSAELMLEYLHPRLYALHTMGPECGTPVEKEGSTEASDQVILPPRMNLSSERLERHGCYLLSDGQHVMLWVGREVSPRLLQDLFNVSSYAALPAGKLESPEGGLPEVDHEFNHKVRAILRSLRCIQSRNLVLPDLHIVKEDGDPALRMWFLSHLVQDRAGEVWSYPQFLQYLKDQLNKD